MVEGEIRRDKERSEEGEKEIIPSSNRSFIVPTYIETRKLCTARNITVEAREQKRSEESKRDQKRERR